MFKLRSAFLLLIFVASLATLAQTAGVSPKIVDETALKDGVAGRSSVDPCEDFYQFACGTWLDQTVIPGDRQAVNRTTPLDNATDGILNKILVGFAFGDRSVPAKYATQLGEFYQSCLDVDSHQAPITGVIQAELQKISQARSREEIAGLVARMHSYGAPVLFGFGSAQSPNDSTRVVAEMSQGGFALPTRDYYFDRDAKSLEIIRSYRQHIAKIFILLGHDNADAFRIAKQILKIERDLAEKAMSLTDLSDPLKTNHPFDIPKLKALAPHFAWDVYLRALGLSPAVSLNIDEPSFVANMDAIFYRLTPREIEHYLTWLFINRVANHAGGELEKEHFAFWNHYLNGTLHPLPRWQLCTHATADAMGYALAEAYVTTFDGTHAQSLAELMIDQIKAAFYSDLDQLTHGPGAWLDSPTLAAAQEKVQLLEQKVGAPSQWRNYDSVTTDRNNFLTNTLHVSQFEYRRSLTKIGKPVDKSEWDMMPWEINAYYDRSNNEFVFPFGILQPMVFDPTASAGANFGYFGGGTVGHELTHGFDNAGSQYDSHGNIKNWWSAKTLDQFKKKADCFVQQANGYKIDSVGLNVDGEQTLEENLADQGGVKLGYAALETLLKTRPESSPWLGRFTERQQYWIAYAQSWCTKSTPQSLRERMSMDEHPPEEFRVNAVLMNRPEFARDFSCHAGQKMNPANRCELW